MIPVLHIQELKRGNPFKRAPHQWLLLCLAVTTFLVFSPCFQNEFVNFDDPDYITDNPNIRSLSFENIKKIFSTTVLTSYIPLTILSFAFEHHLFGPSPAVVHVDNVLLHIFNVFLVYAFIRRLSRDKICAIMTALLFAVHPLRVESVAWAVERKDVLHTAFYLSGLICYLRSRQSNRDQKFIWAALLLFILACLAKPQSVTFPFALLTLDYFLEGKLSWRSLQTKIIFFMVSGLSFFITYLPIKHLMGFTNNYSIIDKLVLSLFSLSMYLAKIIFPLSLCALYPAPQKIDGFFQPAIYLGAFFAVVFLVGMLQLIRVNRLWAWGFLFFTTLLSLPVALIWSIGAPLSDRFSYLPSVGIAFVLANAGITFYKTISTTITRRMLVCIFISYIIFLSIFTMHRCGVWKDSLHLWNDVIRQYPHIATAYNNRGNTYNRLGQLNLALEDYNKAIALDNTYALAHNNRGVVYYKEGLCSEAIASYNTAIALDPQNLEAYNNRAVCYFQNGNYSQALEDINYVILKNPNKISAYRNRALIEKAIETAHSNRNTQL